MKQSKPIIQNFEWLFGIAKAHGFSLDQLKEIALIETGKPLNDFNRMEIRDFGYRLCPNHRKVKKL
jgi:elongation factor P hydroxylase